MGHPAEPLLASFLACLPFDRWRSEYPSMEELRREKQPMWYNLVRGWNVYEDDG
jgi:hypothetical protein